MPNRILFIDDQLKDWEKLLRRELEPYGFELKGEEDPSKALKAIASYKPDVVLLDVLFPKGYLGKPTLEKIKKKYPTLPVVMITSTMDKTEYKGGDYARADYRYSKMALANEDFSDLAGILNKLIERVASSQNQSKEEQGLSHYGFIVGQTQSMKELAETIEKLAPQDITVLITGESGTGKELVARAIHRLIPRRDLPFKTVVCAALPKDLLESELFGHEKGAFTGAVKEKKGKFELAGEGTIFLDEVSEIPLETQVKLLRFLQEKKFEPVGGSRTIHSNARVVAATNKEITQLIPKGTFREDLYFRLNVVPLQLPPLRERKQDLPLFFEYFVQKANKKSGKNILPVLREDVREILEGYSWPGNIREMENVVSRSVALADENILQVENFQNLAEPPKEGLKLITDPSRIANQIYLGTFKWNDLRDEFGKKSTIRRQVLLALINLFKEKNNRRPLHKELANILDVTENNMRQIIKVCKIELTSM